MPSMSEQPKASRQKNFTKDMSCSERFSLIDRAVRTQLKTTHLPHGVMEEFEDMISNFYGEGGDGRAREHIMNSCVEHLTDWVVLDECGKESQYIDQSKTSHLASGSRPGRLQIHEPNRFHRCLLHAVAQYFGLTSKSETLSDGRRITSITNPHHPVFYPPNILLSQLCSKVNRVSTMQ